MAGLKTKLVIAILLILVVLLGLIRWLGLSNVLLIILVAACVVWLKHDVLLAKLVCWGIAKTPKKFLWSVDRVFLRPRWERADEAGDIWSMIIMEGWTWHNPPNFLDDPTSYILQCDRFIAHLKLTSIPEAVLNHGSVEIDYLEFHGFRFNAQANAGGTVNLWKAVDLPDDDVNCVMQNVTQQTGPIERHHAVMNSIKALPPVASGATRKAANFWRDEWGVQSKVEAEVKKMHQEREALRHPKSFFQKASNHFRLDASGALTPLLETGYFEYPIGDKRRRPRWGVPLRFNIRRLVLVDVDLWVLDLLMKESSSQQARMANKINIEKIVMTREDLEAGDKRKSGGGDNWHAGDGVHGVYLGELVWALVAKVVPRVAMSSPTLLFKDAMTAAGFYVTTFIAKAEAKSLQSMMNAAHRTLGNDPGRVGAGLRNCTRLELRLHAGREILTANNKAANCFVAFRLWAKPMEMVGSDAEPDAEVCSQMRMWTKTPEWDEKFVLGPVKSIQSTLQVLCYHCRTSEAVKHPVHPMAGGDKVLLGQLSIPVSQLLLEDASIGSDGLVVGWFPLEPEASKTAGELKLGMRMANARHLEDLSEEFQNAVMRRGSTIDEPFIEEETQGCSCFSCMPSSNDLPPGTVTMSPEEKV